MEKKNLNLGHLSFYISHYFIRLQGAPPLSTPLLPTLPKKLPVITEEDSTLPQDLTTTVAAESSTHTFKNKSTTSITWVPTLTTIMAATNAQHSHLNTSEQPLSQYKDWMLLPHPLFQKIFYLFFQAEKTSVLLEFYRDTARLRTEENKKMLPISEEANILHKAYILSTSKKHMGHLSEKIQTGISTTLQTQSDISSSNLQLTRLIFLDAERATENLLIIALQQFKTTAKFKKIAPFIKFDPKQLIELEKTRASLKTSLDDITNSPRIQF